MIAMLRFAVLLVVVQIGFYVLLTIYLRSLERERLENAWAEVNPGRGGDSPERRAYVERRMASFHRTLRAQLVAVVLVLPFVVVMGIAYVVNYT